ncbi:hypothetical protein SAV14893_045320 [Streptomyces avermitilis]|uniref:Uncharacterized protein n=1 Tax=Streptomyces avermitilis TaxID=33903 RepID=A0A4D4M1F3_STRAX|nr:hypothetical protein SAV14893_045320 [Streptomyces avermitilis]
MTTAWPIPAEARTTTDSVVTIRMDQPGRLGRLGRTGGRRAGEGRGRRGGRAAGERGGVGMGDTSAKAWGWGSVSTVGPYDLRPGPVAGRRAPVSPVRGNVTSDEREV